MTITRGELKAYNESAKDLSMTEFVDRLRHKKDMVANTNKIEVKSKRDIIKEELDSLNIEYKGNAKTEALEELLEGAK